MPIAAVPNYLGQNFKDASPAMRFGMYLRLWGIDWSIDATQKHPALVDATHLSERDQKTAAKLLDRQRSAFDTSVSPAARFSIEALATAPFTTGLGNEHPLENGFAFLSPYGLPYLPGSGVKGVLKQAARELASGDWGDSFGWTDVRMTSPISGAEPIALSPIDALFGPESADGTSTQVRGALCFWDVIPQIKGDRLAVEIMTPHQSHYYQQKIDVKAGNSQTPHDSGQPNPIMFLTVPPESGFVFHVDCDLTHLRRIAPELERNAHWQSLLRAAFAHAFTWLGFGAKTAVGYGSMDEDPAVRAREAERQKAAAEAERRVQEKAERQAELAKMSPIERELKEIFDQRSNKDQPELSIYIAELKAGRWKDGHAVEIAQHIKALMQATGKWKEESRKKNPLKDKEYQDTLAVMKWLPSKQTR